MTKTLFLFYKKSHLVSFVEVITDLRQNRKARIDEILDLLDTWTKHIFFKSGQGPYLQILRLASIHIVLPRKWDKICKEFDP